MPPTTAPKAAPPPPVIPLPTANVSTIAASAQAKRPGRLQRRELGKRIVISGVEGSGKTSIVAYASNPLIVMAGNETGYETLMNAGRAPEIDCLHVQTWTEVLDSMHALTQAGATHYDVIGLDVIGALERMMHEHVCATQFENKWDKFGAYQKGFDVAVTDWMRLLSILDKFKEIGTTIVLLSHVVIRPFKNPMGEDFDQYKSNVHHKTWSATHAWSDAVFFINFVTDIREMDSGRHKGLGTSTVRMLYTERRDAFDAKNRYGMPPVIQLPDTPADMWNTISYYLNQTKEQ